MSTGINQSRLTPPVAERLNVSFKAFSTIDSDVHKYVVRFPNGTALGFTSLGGAISTIEDICGRTSAEDLLRLVSIATGDDRNDGDIEVYDIDNYLDLTEEDEDGN